MKNKTIYCIIGASGSGKSTIAQELTKLGIPEVVSHTTRAPRENEINGIHYHFVSTEEFDSIEKLEFAVYGNNKYGTSRQEVELKFANSDKIICVIEINGLKQLKENYSNYANVVSLFIKTDIETMKARMIARNDSSENIEARINTALKINEFSNEKYADYIIDNRGSLEDTLSKVKSIIGI